MQALVAIYVGSFLYIVVRLTQAARRVKNAKTNDIGWFIYIPLPIRVAGTLTVLIVFAPVVAAWDAAWLVWSR